MFARTKRKLLLAGSMLCCLTLLAQARPAPLAAEEQQTCEKDECERVCNLFTCFRICQDNPYGTTQCGMSGTECVTTACGPET